MSDAVAQPAWAAPRLSAAQPAAMDPYRDGIAALVAGAPHAADLLRRAVELDPSFSLARLALTVADAAAGQAGAFVDVPSHLTRGERQHAEIVRAALAGDVDRAMVLRREHLVDFPGDVLIVWLPTIIGRRPGPAPG